jgi:hypothetical protein
MITFILSAYVALSCASACVVWAACWVCGKAEGVANES